MTDRVQKYVLTQPREGVIENPVLRLDPNTGQPIDNLLPWGFVLDSNIPDKLPGREEELPKLIDDRHPHLVAVTREGELFEYRLRDLSQPLSHVKIAYRNFWNHGHIEGYCLRPEEGFPESIRRIGGSNINVTQPLIQAFIDHELTTFKERRRTRKTAGVFLSALIETSDDSDFQLSLKRAGPLHYVGCFLTENKNVTFIGDVNDYLGYKLSGGQIRIEGKADKNVGEKAEKGTIEVTKKIGSIGDSISQKVIIKEGTQIIWPTKF